MLLVIARDNQNDVVYSHDRWIKLNSSIVRVWEHVEKSNWIKQSSSKQSIQSIGSSTQSSTPQIKSVYVLPTDLGLYLIILWNF